MKSLIYFSTPNVEMNDEIIEDIAHTSQAKNQEVNVTGYLCFFENQIFQYIEGDDKDVDELISAISADPRHEIASQFTQESIDNRRFPEWNMRHIRKGSYPEVDLESIIRQHFESETHLSDDIYIKMLWRTVDKLSKAYPELSQSA